MAINDKTTLRARREMGINTAEAQTILAAIVTYSDDAIIGKDLNGTIISWNPAAERIFGYMSDEAIGKHISLIIPPERLGEEDIIIGRLRKGERLDHFETERRTKSGRLVPISITVSPIRNSEGVTVGASKIARDISDRVESERLLHEMSQKKDEFLANMSHELRTPMNAVIGLANILINSKTLDDRDRKFVETLKLSADSLLDLINDLLDFAKIEADSIELEHQPFDMAELAGNVLKLCSVAAGQKQLTLTLQYADTLNRVYLGDALRMQQVLTNIVSNAVKFTERGGVTLDVSGMTQPGSSATQLQIKITDTGIGIAPDMVDAIFEKFSQGDASITRRYGGSGLGLAIARGFIACMGGTIGVQSEVGVGTTFTITAALENTTQPAVGEDGLESLAAVAAHPARDILLVEDYQPNILVASTMIEQFGHSYDTATSGLDAVRKSMDTEYAVILMDVQMPDVDGLEATRRIRRLEKEHGRKRTPIIAMTAHVREQDKKQCLEAGMDDFIPKPFDPRMLAQKLDNFLSQAEEKRREA